MEGSGQTGGIRSGKTWQEEGGMKEAQIYFSNREARRPCDRVTLKEYIQINNRPKALLFCAF
jgi:hypothetical protein